MSATGADSHGPVLPAQFIFALLKRVSKGEEANKAAQEAYKETLMQYHGFMVKKTFQMGLMAAPSTASMLACLGSNDVRTLPLPAPHLSPAPHPSPARG
jgi:hypothetical protein